MRMPGPIRRTSIIQLLSGTRKRALVLIALLSVLGGGCEALLLILIVRVGTVAVGGRVNTSSRIYDFIPKSTGALIVAGLVVGVLTMGLQVGAVLFSLTEARRRAAGMRHRLLHGYLYSSLSGQWSLSPGELQELASQGVQRSTDGFILAANVGSNVANLAMLVIAAFLVSPLASLALIGTGIVLAALFIPISRMNLRANRTWISRNAGFAAFVAVFSRMGVESRVFGVRKEVETEADLRVSRIAGAWMRSRVILRGSPVVFRITILLIAFAVLGLVLVIVPDQVGAVAVIALLLVRALSYVQGIQADLQNVNELSVYAANVTGRIAQLSPDDVRWGSHALPHIRSLTMRGIEFSYGSGVEHLKSVDFEAQRGELVTITGASGGGKSTFLRVLLRLVEPSGGRFTVNDTLSADVLSESDWYERVSYLPQEVRLIPGTVAENVRFFRTATDDEVHGAVDLAALRLDKDAFPDSLDTVVEDEGRNLSGGQRQRIGLARALLKRPDVLVLDEPTSALDPRTELDVVATIQSLKSNMIAVLVTHQSAVARVADRTYVMRKGRLESVGIESVA